MVHEDTTQNHKNDNIVIDVENDTEEHTVERPKEQVSKPRINDPVVLKPRVISVYYYQEQNVGSESTCSRENVGYSTVECEGDSNHDDCIIEDRCSRNAFVRKVYFILMIQLVCAIALICATIYIDKIRKYIRKHHVTAIIACVAYFVLLIRVMCCRCARKTFPINLICLGALTVCFAYIAAYVAVSLDTKIVLMSIIIAAVICLAISVFAWQTRFDMTNCMVACVIIVTLALVVILIIMVISKFVKLKTADIVISAMLVLFGCLLIYDIQMIMDGRRMEMASNEYILGTLRLYIDMMNILLIVMYILRRR